MFIQKKNVRNAKILHIRLDRRSKSIDFKSFLLFTELKGLAGKTIKMCPLSSPNTSITPIKPVTLRL